MKELEIKSISAWHGFKVSILMFAVCFIIIGIIMSSYALVLGTPDKFLGAFSGSLILVLILSLTFAFLVVVLIWLYNLIAKLVGGCKIKIEEKEPLSP